jgi:hypothetical protein
VGQDQMIWLTRGFHVPAPFKMGRRTPPMTMTCGPSSAYYTRSRIDDEPPISEEDFIGVSTAYTIMGFRYMLLHFEWARRDNYETGLVPPSLAIATEASTSQQ